MAGREARTRSDLLFPASLAAWVPEARELIRGRRVSHVGATLWEGVWKYRSHSESNWVRAGNAVLLLSGQLPVRRRWQRYMLGIRPTTGSISQSPTGHRRSATGSQEITAPELSSHSPACMAAQQCPEPPLRPCRYTMPNHHLMRPSRSHHNRSRNDQEAISERRAGSSCPDSSR